MKLRCVLKIEFSGHADGLGVGNQKEERSIIEEEQTSRTENQENVLSSKPTENRISVRKGGPVSQQMAVCFISSQRKIENILGFG